MKRIVFSILMMLAACGQAMAIELSATVDRNRVSMGEPVNLTVEITGGPGEVDTSAIKDFKVAGSGTSTSIQINNGKVTKAVAHTYTLIPRGHGRLKIPTLRVTSDGKVYRTREILVSVEKGNSQTMGDDAVFVKATVSNATPYEGQHILYTFRFYQAVQAVNPRLQGPTFEGFSAKKIDEKKQYTTVISGRKYTVTELNYVLIPLKVGDLAIEPALLTCDVVQRSSRRTRNRSVFDQFFAGGSLVPHSLQTESLPVTVVALPPLTGNAAFSGLVGQFQMEAHVDETEITVGGAATLSVTVTGSGNIMDARMPAFDIPDAFKVYADNPEEAIKFGAAGFTGKKTFKNALVAVREGQYTVGPISLWYFDTDTGDYTVLTAPMMSVDVLPGGEKEPVAVYTAPGGDRPPQMTQKKVAITGHDILPLREDLDALETHRQLSRNRFALMLALPMAMYLMFRFVVGVLRRKHDDKTLMARRANNALKSAAGADADPEVFLTCLRTALIAAVRSISESPVGESLTYSEARRILERAGFDGDLIEQAVGLFKRIESARYGGLNLDAAHRSALLDETRALSRRIG